MPDQTQSDVEAIWKRVGLNELRQQLNRLVQSTDRFEKALRMLPECDACARLKLLEHIEKTGRHLSSEVTSFVSLAETLKSTVGVMEKCEQNLKQNKPHTCECGDKPCSCH